MEPRQELIAAIEKWTEQDRAARRKANDTGYGSEQQFREALDRSKELEPAPYTHGYDCPCDACQNCEPAPNGFIYTQLPPGMHAPPIRVQVGPGGVRVVQPCSESRAAWLEKFADYGRRERAAADDFARAAVILVATATCAAYLWGVMAVVGR